MGTTTEKLTYLQGTKDAIKNAIVAKGVEVPEGTTFRGYAEKVGEISGIKIAILEIDENVPKGQISFLTPEGGIVLSEFTPGMKYEIVVPSLVTTLQMKSGIDKPIIVEPAEKILDEYLHFELTTGKARVYYVNENVRVGINITN